MRAINLLPADAKERKPVNRLALAGASSTTALTMLLAAGYIREHSAVVDKSAELDSLREQLATLPQPKQAPAEDGRFAKERSDRVAALASALDQRVAWDRLLRELSSVLPDDVWLTAMQAKVPTAVVAQSAPASGGAATPAAAPGSSTFSIQGYTYSHDGVARLLARLELVPELMNLDLESSQLATLEGQSVVQFSINAELRKGGPSS